MPRRMREQLMHNPEFGAQGLQARRQTFGADRSPRKIAAFHLANSSKLLARRPRIPWMIGETCASLPLRRSAKSSARASAMYGGTPAARLARVASSGVTLMYWMLFPVAVESLCATSASLIWSSRLFSFTSFALPIQVPLAKSIFH